VLLVAVFLASVAQGAGAPIGTQLIAPTVAQPRDAVLAPLGDGFLAIWTEGPSCYGQELRGMRLDGDGHPRDARSFAVTPVGYQPRVVATASEGDDAYVAWGDASPNLHLTRVSADGAVTVLSDSLSAGRKMSVSNGNILILGSRSAPVASLTVTLIDRGGRVVRSDVALEQTGSPRQFDLIAVNDTFLVAWTGNDDHLRVASISPADVAANNVRITPADLGITSNLSGLRLVSDGVHSMVFWVDFRSSKYGLRARSLSNAGTPMDAGPVTIGSVTPTGDGVAAVAVSDGYNVLVQESLSDGAHPVFLRVSFDGTLQVVNRPSQRLAVARNGSRTMALWMEQRFAITGFFHPFAGYEIVAAPLAADGSVGTGTMVSLDVATQHVRKLLPFAGGTVALWTEGVPNDRLVVSRLTPAGQPADNGLRLRESLFNQSHSTIATDGERLFVVWTEGEESKPQALFGAMVLPGGILVTNQLASDASGDSDIDVVWNGQGFTVAYQRVRTKGFDFAAMRVDRFGNLVDPTPIPLTLEPYYDQNPRLSWNGSEYLLVWQRWYDPFMYIGETCPQEQLYPAELFAQRYSEALVPTGMEIPLATTNNKGTVLLDAQRAGVSFVRGTWLVVWLDKVTPGTRFARIDANGVRLDPLNGQLLLGSFDDPILVTASDGWTVAGHEGYGPNGPGRGLALTRIDLNGRQTLLDTLPISGTSAIEGVVLTPVPIGAFKRSISSAAYVGSLATRLRAVR